MSRLPDPKHALYPPWCLIESAPETFQGMTQSYGVRGVQVNELLSIDDLLTLNRDVHGLILSSAMDWETSPGKSDQMDPDASSLFFSCQVVTNVCATSALLGVLLNIEDDDLVIGDELKYFKDFTKEFDPVDRGMAIANSSLLQKTHNAFGSFESKMMAKQYPQYRDIKPEKHVEEDHPDYHFVAFIPAKGYVWELDGYNKVPVKLHKITKNWLEHLVDELKGRFQKSSDVNVNMLYISKSLKPTSSTTSTKAPPSATTSTSQPYILPATLQNHRATLNQRQHAYSQLIYRIEGYLDIICHNWKKHSFQQHVEHDANAPFNIENDLSITPYKDPTENIGKIINSAAKRGQVISLLKLHQEAHTQLYRLSVGKDDTLQRNEFEKQAIPVETSDNKSLLQRQHDYGPFIDALFTKLDDEDLL